MHTTMRPDASGPTGPHPALDSRQRPLRILLASDWWDNTVNGVVASVATLRRELESLGHEVRVLTLADDLRSRYDGQVYRLGSIPASLIYADARIGLLGQEAIHRDILRWAPDVVHSHNEFTAYRWARRISSELAVPHVHTYHTIYEDYTHYYSPSLTVGRKVAAAFSRRTLAPTQAVIAPTEKVARLLAGYRVHSPVHVVPTGLALDRFRPASGSAEEADTAYLRTQLQIPAEHTVLVGVGRLAKEKNIEELLADLARVGRADWTLALVGDGPHRAAIAERVAQLGLGGQVRFTGVVDPSEVPRYYRLADVFVSASRSETQGLTYIEAQACGVPLLCRRDPALDQVVLDGRTGWQYDTSAEFTQQLTDLLDDHQGRVRMGKAAAAHAHAHFGSAAFGARVAQIYQDTRASQRSRQVWP